MAHFIQLGRPDATPRSPATAEADQPDSTRDCYTAGDPSLKKNDLGHVLPVSRPAYRDRVADWAGEGRNTAELYLGMAVHELHGVSPSYEALCRAVAGSEPICARCSTGSCWSSAPPSPRDCSAGSLPAPLERAT
jgi:hypothetical protein